LMQHRFPIAGCKIGLLKLLPERYAVALYFLDGHFAPSDPLDLSEE